MVISRFLDILRTKKPLYVSLDIVNRMTFIRLMLLFMSPCCTQLGSVYLKTLKNNKRKMFVEEVMELVELTPLRSAVVGLPGFDGLSTEQRKRLTIVVELVANPSIIFMDEPTSGLDARAAAIVMRAVRNTVDTGRIVVCTIQPPSIDIFEAFDAPSMRLVGHFALGRKEIT